MSWQSMVLVTGETQRLRDELQRDIRVIVAFADGTVTIEVDPEGVLGEGEIEF